MQPKLGILAGGGQLPTRLMAACRATERPYFVIAFKGHTPEDAVRTHPHAWVRLGAAGKALNILKDNQVTHLVFAGDIERPGLSQLRPDWWAVRFLAKSKIYEGGDDRLLSTLVRTLEREEGFQVVGVHQVLSDILAPSGFISSKACDLSRHQKDIQAAIGAALELGRADKGQAAVARGSHVIDMEDEHGTDALLCRIIARQDTPLDGQGGGVLAKVAKPGQEVRADLPTIGPETVRMGIKAGLAGIVVESGRSLVVDQDTVREIADNASFFVVAVDLCDDVNDIYLPVSPQHQQSP